MTNASYVKFCSITCPVLSKSPIRIPFDVVRHAIGKPFGHKYITHSATFQRSR